MIPLWFLTFCLSANVLISFLRLFGEDRNYGDGAVKGDDHRGGNTMTFEAGQANNAYIFPGLGLAMVSIHASSVTDLDFIVAAHALAETVSVEDLRRGRGFPPLSRLREVSLHIAAVTALHVAKEGRSLLPKTHLPTTLEEAGELCAKHQYNPHGAYDY